MDAPTITITLDEELARDFTSRDGRAHFIGESYVRSTIENHLRALERDPHRSTVRLTNGQSYPHVETTDEFLTRTSEVYNERGGSDGAIVYTRVVDPWTGRRTYVQVDAVEAVEDA